MNEYNMQRRRKAVRDGQRVVMSNAEYDAWIDAGMPLNVVSTRNPSQVGTRDALVVFVKLPPVQFNVTYDVVTPESAEFGETADSGFELQDYQPDNIDDIISLVERYAPANEWSNSNGSGWLITVDDDIDIMTSGVTTYAIHPANERSARYLRHAVRLAR